MNQEQRERKHSQRRPYAESSQKRVPRFQWAWEFWSEHADSILLLFFGALFLSPITEFMSKQTKVWSIGLGFWLLIGAVIVFICKSAIKTIEKENEGPPVREHAESPPRFLTKEQSDKIVSIILPFKGQKASVQCPASDREAARYAQQLLIMLKEEAKWDASDLMYSPDFADFDSVTVSVSKEDFDRRSFPKAATALSNALALAGVTKKAGALLPVPNLPNGSVRLDIGINPLLPGYPK